MGLYISMMRFFSARTAAKNLAEKKRIMEMYKPKSAKDLQDDQNKAKLAIAAIGGGGTLLSAYFFKDAGYDTLAKKKNAVAAKKAGRGKAAKKELVGAGAAEKKGPFGLF